MNKHRCFACDLDNPLCIVTSRGEDWTFKFKKRFVGPLSYAHGGIAIGALTCPALQLAKRDGMLNPVALRVTGRFYSPVPLTKTLNASAYLEEGRYSVQLKDDSKVVLNGDVEVIDRETNIGSVLQEPPNDRIGELNELSELALADIEGPNLFIQLRQIYEDAGVPWPGDRCFGCSQTENALKLHHVGTPHGDAWSLWETEPTFTDGDGRLSSTIIAAALDCATMLSVNAKDFDFAVQLLQAKKIWMTGSFGVWFLREPPVEIDGGYVITSRYLGANGRQLYAISALHDRKGSLYAVGEATLIIFDSQLWKMANRKYFP